MLFELFQNEPVFFVTINSFIFGLLSGIIIMRMFLKQKNKLIEELRQQA